MTTEIEFKSGTARIVQGDAYQGSSTNDKGEQNIYKSGPQVGQSFNTYFI